MIFLLRGRVRKRILPTDSADFERTKQTLRAELTLCILQADFDSGSVVCSTAAAYTARMSHSGGHDLREGSDVQYRAALIKTAIGLSESTYVLTFE